MSESTGLVAGFCLAGGLLVGGAIGGVVGHLVTPNCAPHNGEGKQCVENIDQDPDPSTRRDEPVVVVYPPTPPTSIMAGR